MRRLRRRAARVPPDLAVLLAVAAIGALCWSVVVPPINGPDEDQHIAYVTRIVETGSLPQTAEPGPAFSTEMETALRWAALRPLIGNLSAKPGTTEAEQRAWERAAAQLDAEDRGDGSALVAAANNPPLYYLWLSVPYAIGLPGDWFARVQLMRAGSILLLLVTVTCAWLLAAELLPRPRWARTVAAGAVAVHPQLSFISSMVNPDAGLAAAWSAGLLLAVRLVRRGPTTRRVLALGLACAAAALVQPRGLPLAGPAAVALGLALWRFRPPLRAALGHTAVLGACVLAGAGLYYYVVSVLGAGQTGGQLTATAEGAFDLGQFLSYVWRFYLPETDFLGPPLGPDYGFDQVYVRGFFGVFGSLEVLYSDGLYRLLRLGVLAGLAGLVVAAVVRRRALARHRDSLLVLLTGVVSLVGALHLAAYRTLQDNGGVDPILVGRYLFPLIALFGLAVAFLATSLPRRAGPYLGAAALAAGLLLQIAGLGLTLTRFHG